MRSLFDALRAWPGSGAALAPDLNHAFSASPAPNLNHAQEESDGDEEAVHKRYRTIFISDLHLGTPGCQATALLDFLRAHPSDNLYLVGDIVDGWQLRRKWYWPQSHNDVVQKLLRRARKGCRIVYVPGNHDEFARGFLGHQFGGIEVVEEAVHVTADGRQLWVIHGDYFDAVVQCAKWLAYVGDNLYEFTLRLNRHLNRLRARIGLVLRMLEQRGFRNLRSWTHGVDTQLFSFQPQPLPYPPMGTLVRPVSLFVGRVSYEKNIEAFLKLDLPGTKVVCGVGPLESALKERYPQIRWMGVVSRTELAKVYAAADVFVFPSRSETFGLVMLESMASGTPVAAYPVDGPLEVLGKPDGSCHGGVMNTDLRAACYSALALPRHEARLRALDFSWTHAAQMFEAYLVHARPADHATGANTGCLSVLGTVTPLS